MGGFVPLQAPVTLLLGLKKVLQTAVPVLGHVPWAVRPPVGDALAAVLWGVVLHPTDAGHFVLLVFPELEEGREHPPTCRQRYHAECSFGVTITRRRCWKRRVAALSQEVTHLKPGISLCKAMTNALLQPRRQGNCIEGHAIFAARWCARLIETKRCHLMLGLAFDGLFDCTAQQRPHRTQGLVVPAFSILALESKLYINI